MGVGQLYEMEGGQLFMMAARHMHDKLENGLKCYSLNFNGISHVFDRT